MWLVCFVVYVFLCIQHVLWLKKGFVMKAMTDNALAVFENYKIRRRDGEITNYELEITNDGSA